MKLYRVTFSPIGGAEKMADTLSYGWDYRQETMNLLEVDQGYGVYKLEANDVCIMAVPSFGGRVLVVALERLSSMKRNQTKAVLATVYSNWDLEDMLLELKDTLETAGFRCVAVVVVVAEHSITHQFVAGGSGEKDVAQLKTFAE